VSAKGGDLLTRTVDNFFPPSSRETERLRNGGEDSEDDDDEGTPKDEKMDVDEPGSLGRSTRCRLYSGLAAVTMLTSCHSTPPCAPAARALPA
jgi:hypothetical protein